MSQTNTQPELEILTYPAAVLLEQSCVVQNIDGTLQDQIDKMTTTLYHARGLGLAAPQVGYLQSFFIYDLSQQEDANKHGDGLVVILNPEIVAVEGDEVAEEGCLSLPGYFEKVRRAYRVQMKGLDREGKEISIEAEGLAARLFQHEIDHLNGVLMLDHLSSLKRSIFMRKLRKKQRQAELD